ncbi:MAG: DUF2069 domain-containing protein [Burkholderiaceae bacterium]
MRLLRPDPAFPALLPSFRILATVGCALMVALGIAWEAWLAPIRPGGWMLSLKMLPLALALPAIARGNRRTYQWWSMGILLYFTEAIVRATSDTGPSVPLAWAQTGLAVFTYCAILGHARQTRPAPPATGSDREG